MAIQYYSGARDMIDSVAEDIVRAKKLIDRAGEILTQASDLMANVPVEYGTALAEIQALVDANPNNNAWKFLGAEKDQLQSDYQAIKATADAKKTAFDAA